MRGKRVLRAEDRRQRTGDRGVRIVSHRKSARGPAAENQAFI